MILLDFLKKGNYNVRITKIESKIPSIVGSVTTAALNAVEIKICNVIDLRTDYNTKILEIETKYYSIFNCNKFYG